jgi:hypothetical protein
LIAADKRLIEGANRLSLPVNDLSPGINAGSPQESHVD